MVWIGYVIPFRELQLRSHELCSTIISSLHSFFNLSDILLEILNQTIFIVKSFIFDLFLFGLLLLDFLLVIIKDEYLLRFYCFRNLDVLWRIVWWELQGHNNNIVLYLLFLLCLFVDLFHFVSKLFVLLLSFIIRIVRKSLFYSSLQRLRMQSFPSPVCLLE